MRKPDHEAFLNAADTLEVSPGQCLFIDDRAANIEAANEVGMDAILMRGADALRRELSERELFSR